MKLTKKELNDLRTDIVLYLCKNDIDLADLKAVQKLLNKYVKENKLNGKLFIDEEGMINYAYN